jgi:mRNA interferase MazF
LEAGERLRQRQQFIQIDRANAVSPHTIIALLKTKIRRALLASHVFIPAGIGGLTQA